MGRNFDKTYTEWLHTPSGSGTPGVNFPRFVSLWFRINTTSTYHNLMAFTRLSESQHNNIYVNTSNVVYLEAKGYDGSPQYLNLGSITLNTWNHVWACWISNSSMKGALNNGTEQSSSSYQGNYAAMERLNVGNLLSSSSGMYGDLAELSIYTINQTTLIKRLLYEGHSPWYLDQANLEAYWPLWGTYNLPGTGAFEQCVAGNHAWYLHSATQTDPDETPQSDHPPVMFFLDFYRGSIFCLTSAQDIVPTGIATAEAFGTPSVIYDINPTGIPSEESFGDGAGYFLQVNLQMSTVNIPSAELFGVHAVSMEEELVPHSILTEEVWGFLTVNRGSVNIGTLSIFTEETFGTPELITEVLNVTPTGIASEETFGAPSFIPLITPNGVPSEETFGNTIILPGNVNIAPNGIISGETFGTAEVEPGTALVPIQSIPSEEAFGGSSTSTGNINIVPSGIPSEETFGSITITVGNVDVLMSGIPSEEAFGSTTLLSGNINVVIPGISSEEAFGNFIHTPGSVDLGSIVGVPSEETFGTIIVSPGPVGISFTSIDSEESFGGHTVIPGDVNLNIPSITSTEAFGAVNVDQIMYLTGIPSGEVFGTSAFTTGPVDISILGIPSEEIFSNSIVRNLWVLGALSIPSVEAFGNHTVVPFVKSEFQTLMDEDLDNIYGEDEFEESGWFTPKQGTGYGVIIIFDNEFVEMNSGAQAAIMSRSPMITIRDRFRKRPTRGDKLNIRGVNYSVLTYEPDGVGLAVLELQHERTN